MKFSPRGMSGLGLISLAGLAATCGSALGQSTWLNPADGNWSDASKWSAGVPNGFAAVVNQAGTYNIAFNGNYSIPSLTQTVPGVTISVLNSLTYSMTGPISNDGLIRINDGTGVNETYLRLTAGGQTLSGTGTIRLGSSGNVASAQLTTNSGSWALTQTAGHSVRGDGAIYVPMANAGTIAADTSGRTLLVQNGGIINTGLLTATNGATLRLNSVPVNGTGNIFANSGTVTLSSSGVSAQTVTSAGTGFVNVLNSTFSDVTCNGDVRVADNHNLNCNPPGVVNNGTIAVNDGSGVNGTYFRLTGGSTSLTGSGVLRLRSNGNLDTAQVTTNSGAWTLTHGANHQIRGDGRIYVPINNLGSIIADTTGRNLEVLSSTSSNSGLISAENGSTVRIGSVTMNQTANGVIRAITNGAVILDSSAINSGSVTSTGAAATLIRNTTLNDVILTGQAQVPDNNNLNVPAAGFTNNGSITIQNGGPNGCYMRLTGGSATVGGTGNVILNAGTNLDTAQITTNSGSWTYTSSAGQTIRGTGRIYTPMTNNGTIVADRAGAQLQWLNSGSTNNNLVTTAGGGFTFSSITLTQGPNGRIVAANGDVSINASNIIGGTIEGTGSPVMVLNSTFTNPTVSGDVRVPNVYTLNVPAGGFTNNGTIRVSDGAGANGTYIRLIGGSAPINGTGTIVLDATNNPDTAQLTTNSGSWAMTITSGQTVRGTGRIYTPLVNDGLIVADRTDLALDWRSSTSSNNSIARTSNGGNLQITSTTLNQAANAQLLASDGPVTINSSTINGGIVNGQNSPANVLNSVFSGVTTEGDVRVPNIYTLGLVATGIVNNGVLSVSDGVGANATYIRLQGGNSTISGNGSVVLKATSNVNTAQLVTNSGSWTMIFGASQTLRGSGAVYTPTSFAGTFSPGFPEFFTGTVFFGGSPVTIPTTGRATFDVLSPTDHDRATGNSNWNIQGGTLTIRFPGGFVGALGQSYTLIAGNSVTGRFTTIQLPAHPTQGLKYGVDYRSNSVVLRTTCNIDFNSDGVLDLFDYLDFVEIFQGGQLDADYNGDGITDFFDYLDFVAEFAAGCN